jgi:hypothetical protein
MVGGFGLFIHTSSSAQTSQDFEGSLVVFTNDSCLYIGNSESSWIPLTTSAYDVYPSVNDDAVFYITENADDTGTFYHYDVASQQSTAVLQLNHYGSLFLPEWSKSGNKLALTYNPDAPNFDPINDKRQLVLVDFSADRVVSQVYNVIPSRYRWLEDDTLLVASWTFEEAKTQFHQLDISSSEPTPISIETLEDVSNLFTVPEAYFTLQEQLAPFELMPTFPRDRGYPSYLSISPRQDSFVRITISEAGGFNSQCYKYDVALHGITVDSIPHPIFQPSKEDTLMVDDVEWLLDDTIVFAHQNSAFCNPNDSQTRLMRVLPDGTVTVLINQLAPLHEVYYPYAPSPDNTQIAWISADITTINLTDIDADETAPFFSLSDIPPAEGCANTAFNGLFWLSPE